MTLESGVHVVDSEVDLSSGEVRENLIGACVQAAGYDVARLTDDVRYIENGTNLDSVELPVPDPTVPAVVEE